MTVYDTSGSFNMSIETSMSALATAADGMSSGQWASFTMPDLDNAVLFAESSTANKSFVNGFGYEMLWDPVHKVMALAGTAHTGGTLIVGSAGYAVWDDATNTWSRETYDGNSDNATGSPVLIGHPYYHNAVNTVNGDWYYRNYNSTGILRRVYGNTGSSSWASFSTIGGSYANQVAGGLRFFPEMNSGAGGLVFVDVGGAKCSNSALTSWTDATGTSPTLGNLQNFIAYSNGEIFFGGGNSNSNMYKLSSGKVVSACASTPLVCGSSNAGTIIPHPNGLDLFAFNCSASSAYYKYTASSDTWSASLGNHGLTRGNIWTGCAIPDYGVIVFIEFPGSVGTPTCMVYKP